jgi:pimeloyl-ACP methyl ester carboxylesterase
VFGGQLEAINIAGSATGNPGATAVSTVDEAPELSARSSAHIVLLHEGLGSVGLWRSFPQQLHSACPGAEVFAYSRHGYGASALPSLPRPASYMHHEADAVLPHILHERGIEAPVLVGHSDGASIALLYAGLQRAAPPRGLVLIAPHVFVEDITIAGIEAARDAYCDGDLRTRLARHHGSVDAAFRGWNDVWLSPSFRTWSIEDRLACITCPVLLIQGANDPYGTEAQLDAIETGVGTPNADVARLIIDGCGHAPHLENPSPVIAAIRVFMQQLAQA